MSAQVNYNLSGKWEGNAGQKVYISSDSENKQKIDSTTVGADETYKFTGSVKKPQRVWVNFNDKHSVFYVDGTPATLDVKKKGGTTFTGSENQKVLRKSSDQIMGYCLVRLAGMLALSRAKDSKSQAHKDTVYMAIDTLYSASERSMDKYLDSIRGNITAPYYIQDFYTQYRSYDDVVKAYDKLTDEVKNSEQGKDLAAQIKDMSQYVVGGTAPNFTSTTPQGKKLSLYSLRGHILLIDFWASWCGPCLREMPNVKSIYAKYHSKGLEILGVSLDRQKDQWVKAIKDKGLTWHHVSSLMEFSDPIARQFHVTAIPRMFILDQNGKIIAQDLRGEALAKKMDELFKGK
jgi:peroxiredoxin